MSDILGRLIEAALKRRAPLIAGEQTTAIRLFHGRADGQDGLVIERCGPVLIVQIHEGPVETQLDALRPTICELHQRLGTRAVYVKRFVRDRSKVSEAIDAAHHESAPWIGEPAEGELEIREGPLKFLIRPYDGFSVGLFLEHRDNRARIGQLSGGRNVLNLFAYTCGFSVAALRGGATTVESVDLSKRYLEWGKQNFEINSLDPARGRFFCSDVGDFFKRATRQGRRYGLIIIDPPTFSMMRRPKRVFVLAEELESLVAGAVSLLEPGGMLFLSLNDREIAAERMAAALLKADPQRRAKFIERPPLPVDFNGDPDFSKTLIAAYD